MSPEDASPGPDQNARQIAPHATMKAALRTLTPRERALLELYHVRGASYRQLAAACGVTRDAVRQIVRRARRRATDPRLVATVRNWTALSGEERRLARLHILGRVSLREIARRELYAEDGRALSATALRRRIHRIERKVARAEARRKRRKGGGDGDE